jgi:hypothetical protein
MSFVVWQLQIKTYQSVSRPEALQDMRVGCTAYYLGELRSTYKCVCVPQSCGVHLSVRVGSFRLHMTDCPGYSVRPFATGLFFAGDTQERDGVDAFSGNVMMKYRTVCATTACGCDDGMMCKAIVCRRFSRKIARARQVQENKIEVLMMA